MNNIPISVQNFENNAHPNTILAGNFSSGNPAYESKVINCCMISLGLSFMSVVLAWNIFSTPDIIASKELLPKFLIAAALVGIIAFSQKKLSVITANIYAVLQGFVLGIIAKGVASPCIHSSAAINDGVFQPVFLWFFTAFAVILLHKAKIVDVTQKFRMVFASSSLGILLFYTTYVPLLSNTTVTPWDLVPACNFLTAMVFAWSTVVDIAFIVDASKCKLPGYMSWFFAFWLMIGMLYACARMIIVIMPPVMILPIRTGHRFNRRWTNVHKIIRARYSKFQKLI
ncbi:MAG: Bax inhibitor-1/YccA family protein [Puniceicoccales bacterium]|nr:Bax inhibitor-1/YccA family protein [Puniceicoccales bacterium]